MKPHARAPNGRFLNGMIVFGSLERGSIAARGYWIEPPDLRGASYARLNEFQDKIRALLAHIAPGLRLQIQWGCDSDYRPELERYYAETQGMQEPAARAARNERFTRYWSRMQARELRRERLALFLSIEIAAYSGNVRTSAGLRAHYDKLLGQVAGQFEEFAETLRRLFSPDTVSRAMSDSDHFSYLCRFLNPSLADRNESTALFDPSLTLQENCWHSQGVGQPGGGFYLDGHYHAILALSRWPQRTRPGIVVHLTGLPFLDYQITVAIAPGASAGEIKKEEKAVERLEGEYADQRRHSLLVALRKKEKKIESLAGGFARPFFVTYIVRAWDRTPEGLGDKLAAIKASIHAMDGAQYCECALPTTAKKLFFASWPGWTHSSYRHRELYAEDPYLADMLPFSATFTGHLAGAEALYDGSHGNLVGVSTFQGGSPQHAVLLGMTGAGKSEALRDLLLQTAGYFSYTVIVEEGLSHQAFTKALGESPIIVHPDSPLTFNYLDTQGLPLTQLQIASAVALLGKMIGEPNDAEKLALRQAQLAQYLHQIYHDSFADWSRRFPEKAREAERLACAVQKWQAKLPPGATPLEAFVDLRDRRRANDAQAEELVAGIPDAEITRFCREPATARFAAQTACASYSAVEFPTHSALVELMAYGRLPEHPKDEIDRLATLLRAWCVTGQYGKLFDGTTNVSLGGKVAHFELGLIPEHAIELKAAAGLLLSGFTRQRILTLPRSQRKRILFEEVARLHDVPGGDKLISEGYAQLRKFGCWVVSVVQQYAMFKNSRIRPAVIGNAKQFFLMRQHDRADLADLARDLALPETAVDAVQAYPMPESLPAGGKYSSLCYFAPTAQPPLCGTLRHVARTSSDENAVSTAA